MRTSQRWVCHRVRAVVVILAIYFLLPVLLLVAGYLQLAEALSRQAATGVLFMVLGAASGLWLLNNISW